VLVVDGVPYWLGMGKDLPKKGINFSGEWFEGKKDAEGRPYNPPTRTPGTPPTEGTPERGPAER